MRFLKRYDRHVTFGPRSQSVPVSTDRPASSDERRKDLVSELVEMSVAIGCDNEPVRYDRRRYRLRSRIDIMIGRLAD